VGLAIDMISSYPSQEHLNRLVKELVAVVDTAQLNVSRHIIFLQGEHGLNRHDTDRELPFRQESNFHYLTGSLIASSTFVVDIPLNEGSAGAVSRKLFIPQETAEASLWSIPPPSLDVAAKQCGFERESMGYSGSDDESHFKGILENADKTTIVHVLSNKLLDPLYPHPSSWLTELWDSKNEYAPFFTSEYLLKGLHRARLVKTSQEIEYIREANRITSGAHEVVMRELGRFARRRDVNTVGADGKVEATKRTGKEGLTEWEIESEADAEAVFVATCKRAG
jgi:Xaa-Pro dipeptidase